MPVHLCDGLRPDPAACCPGPYRMKAHPFRVDGGIHQQSHYVPTAARGRSRLGARAVARHRRPELGLDPAEIRAQEHDARHDPPTGSSPGSTFTASRARDARAGARAHRLRGVSQGAAAAAEKAASSASASPPSSRRRRARRTSPGGRHAGGPSRRRSARARRPSDRDHRPGAARSEPRDDAGAGGRRRAGRAVRRTSRVVHGDTASTPFS